MVIRVPYAGGIGGVEHHCDSSEAYYAHTPGLKVVTPATVEDAYSLLRDGDRRPGPGDLPGAQEAVLGQGRASTCRPRHRAVRPGRRPPRRARDATLVAYGPTVPVALEAAEAAAGGGLGPGGRRPAHARAVRRRDRHARRSAGPAGASWSRRRRASPGSARRSPPGCRSAASTHLHAPVLRVTGFDIPYPPPKLEHAHLPGVDRILDAVARLQWDDEPDRGTPWAAACHAADQVFLLPDLGEGLTEAEIVELAGRGRRHGHGRPGRGRGGDRQGGGRGARARSPARSSPCTARPAATLPVGHAADHGRVGDGAPRRAATAKRSAPARATC